MSTSRFAYKELPKFEPRYYRQWARVVKDAFAERDWNDYLITPAPVAVPSSEVGQPTTYIIFTPDASISARAKAFLSQLIEFRYQPSIETCETAAKIWTVFLQRYGQRSRDDELRLEAELLSLIKLSTQTLDEYIEKFDNIISSIHARQEPNQRWDDRKVNMHFIRSKTRIGKHGPHTSAAHTKPCRTIHFNPPAEHITPPIWLRSELSNHRNTPIRPLLLLPLKTRTPPPPQQEHLHFKRPPPDADADVEMIEQILVVVDVAVVLADVAAEISEEISLEIPTLGALTVRFRDTLPPTAILNTRIQPPIQVSMNGVLLNRLHPLHILHRSRQHPMLLLHLPQIVILNSPQKITAVATLYDPAAVSHLQKIRGSTIPHVRNT